ncbi:MAG: protein translocase subunit SecD [Hyphomicrobiaceae bacterium]
MMYFTRAKTLFILGICLVGILACVPNFLSDATYKALPGWAQHRIGLGLDLRGGAHLLMSMDSDQLKKDWLGTLRDDARKNLREAKIGFNGIAATANSVQIRLTKPEEADAAILALKKLTNVIAAARFAGASDISIAKGAEPGLIVVEPTEAGIRDRISNAAAASIETVRRRIDAYGTTEPNIVRQGDARILIQVPGVEDTKALKDLIGSTAKLAFHEVHPQVTADEAKSGRVPSGYKIYKADPKDAEAAGREYVLRETPVVDGGDLSDAHPGFEQRTNEAIISFRFNQSGARKFGNFTKDNVGRPFAIVLDDKVLSAPVIREAILGGSGQISGSYTPESANALAIQLRSGALPAKLTVVEERTVGANLGQDSIDAGKRAAIVGMVAVVAFMVYAYGLLGIFASLGAALHVVLVFAIMSILGSTMTLPGIAGIVLTIGMSVDANVLIYERIREELRAGKAPIAAIEQGFERAYGTIIDSQLTTFIAGLVMFLLGSGPIRGFAVTLTLGIITTVFTAFTVTRLLVFWWLKAQKTRKIDAPLSYKMARR